MGMGTPRRLGSGNGNAGHGGPIRGREEEIGDDKWRKKMMTSGAHTSVIGETSCSKVYVFGYTCTATGPMLDSYVFHGIFVGIKELQCYISK
jgi:hypothetical protein